MSTNKNNLAVVLYGKNDLRLEKRSIPQPKSNEALLQIECVGICGSDVHFWVHGQIGTCIVETPMIIGHEAAGTVVKVGSDVNHLKPGDRVAIEPGIPCRTCSLCKEGHYHECDEMVFCACPPYDGNLAQFYSQAADYLYKLPDHVSFEEGAMLEPFSVAVHACKRGDRVAIEPGIPCRTCSLCKEGHYHECDEMVFCACPPYDGNLAQFYSQAADYLYKLPDHVSFEEGAMLEPFSVAVHACKRGGVTANSTILILGAGPIGLCILLAARAFGAAKIIITDLVEFRLQQAKKLGADYTLKINPKENEKNIVAKILEVFGEQPSISFDCTGIESCVRIGMLATKKKGVMVEVGMRDAEMKLPLFEAQCKEVNIIGCYRYCNDYPTALGLIASGKVDVKPLITHHYKLEDSLKAFHTSHTGAGNAIKVMIHANPNWKP